MKVHFFATGDFREGNGANSRFVCYGKGLNNSGIEVKFHFILPGEFNDQGINKDAQGVHEGIPFDYLCGTTKRPRFYLTKFYILFKSWFRSIMLLSKLDNTNSILYFYGPQAFVQGPIILLSRLLKFKTVIEKTEFHSLAQGEAKGSRRLVIKTAYRIIEQNLSHLCDEVVVISRRLKKYYSQRISSERITIVPIIYDPERFSEVSTERTNRIGYIGSFGNKDGVPNILKAYKHLKEQIPDLKLRLIGYQIKSFDLAHEMLSVGLDQNDPDIEITGQVYGSDIPRLLSECDLLLMTRVNSAYANYGFPTKLAEYLATGRPVIATDVSDISYYFDNEVEMRIIESENLDALSNAILDRYNNYEFHSEMGKRGQTAGYRLFNYKQRVHHLAEKLQELLDNKKPVPSEPVFEGE